MNDAFGHDVGDQLLREIARRLTACVRVGDTVARPGGDEFIIVLPEIADAGDAVVVAEKIVRTFAEPVQVGERVLQVTVSVGIAVQPHDGTDDTRELMRKADKAMYAAKHSGRNRYQLFADLPHSVGGESDWIVGHSLDGERA